MRFLIDAQLPPALAREITALGHDTVHVAEIGMLSASDSDIWKRAVELAAALITKDEDFVTMRALDSEGPAVVWVRVGNIRNRDLLMRFVASFPTILSALQRGETVVEFSGM